MSAELFYVNGQAQVVYLAEHGTPWHGEGIAVDTPIYTIEAMESTMPLGVVVKRSMHVETDNGPVEVPGKVTVREYPPTITDDGVSPGLTVPIGPVSDRYGVTQSQDTLRIALATGRPVSCYVMLGEHGQREVASVRLDPLVVDPNGAADRLDRFVNVHNSFDGSGNLMAAETTVRVVCSNTEQMAKREGGAIHKLRHTAGIEGRLDEMAVVVAEATQAGQLIVQQAEDMLRVDGSKAMDAVLGEFFPVPADASDRLKTRRNNLREQVVGAARNDRQMGSVGWNGWAVYNGFTEFLDHGRTVRGAKDERFARMAQALDPTAPTSADKVKAAELILAAV